MRAVEPHTTPNRGVANRRPHIEHIMWVVERPDHHCDNDLVLNVIDTTGAQNECANAFIARPYVSFDDGSVEVVEVVSLDARVGQSITGSFTNYVKT